MKKILLLFAFCLFAGASLLRAQCYGTVQYDQSATANNLSTFTITTANPNELILIAYNGWPGPGSGPITVDGNPATHINTAQTSNSATAEAYCYSAPAAGVHTIVCATTGYDLFNPPNYILFFASAFYATGTCTPLSCSNLTTTETAVGSGTSIAASITTTTANEMIFSSFVYNTGVGNPYAMTAVGATVTETLHVGNGIDAAQGYTNAPIAGVYNVNTTDINSCCGGGTVLVAIIPPFCSVGGMHASSTPTNTTCGNCNGSINLTVIGGTPPYTYTWTPSISTTSSASGLCAGTYTVNVNDAACSDTNIFITVLPSTNPTVTATVTTNEPCNGNSLGSASSTVTGGAGPYTYTWTPSGGTNASASNLSAGTYTISVQDINGCTGTGSVTITQPSPIVTTVTSVPADSACPGENVILSASGATTYTWSTGGTTSSITVIIPAGDTAYYWVKGMVGPCSDSVPFKIKIIPPVTASISATKDSICPHGTTTITVRGLGDQVTYKWSTGATTSTITVTDTVTITYTATVYGLCDSTKIMKTITVIPLPKPAISGSLWKCKGTKDTLTVSSSINPTKYKWSNGETTTSIITGAINGDSTIYVTAENSLGCSVKDSFKIIDRLYPTGVLKYTPSCGNNPHTITATPSGTGPFTFKWNTGGTYDTINVITPDTTTYTVTISNGCATIKTVTVIPDVPTLSACCNTTILLGGDTIISASGLNIIRYEWVPSTGLNCDTCANVIATPTVTTTYTVTGTDIDGCSTDRIVTIVVDIPCFNFTVPNVFTPTNAGTLGLDNVFYIKTSGLDSWSILIYDRWGTEMYKSTNQNQYWDGKTESGAAAPAGVYYYVIQGSCQNNTYKKQGFLQLIR